MKTRYFVPLIFVVAILLITYCFPRQGKFQYSFSEGRPWQYELLTAPFDFPIYKSEAQYKAEQDSILAFYEPYYIIDTSVEKNALAEFDADINLNANLRNLDPPYITYIRQKLLEVYKQGIMNSEEYDKIAASQTRSLRLKEGYMANSRSIESFHTIRSAYEKILNERPGSLSENLLKSANINNYLRENIIYDATTSDKDRN